MKDKEASYYDSMNVKQYREILKVKREKRGGSLR